MCTFVSMFKKAVAVKAYAARTFTKDPLQSYKFKVSISGIDGSVGFKSVSGLSRETEVVEYIENMYDYTHKLPGRETVGEVTFERGMYSTPTLEKKYREIFSNKATRRDVTISICDRFGKERRKFQLGDCWFSGYEVSDLDAESSDVIIETLTLQFEKFL